MEKKFRAWDVKSSKMINYGAFQFNQCHYLGVRPDDTHIIVAPMIGIESGELICDDDLDAFVLMQFTGLHDKNGKEIYEGDILKYSAHSGYGLFPGRLMVKWIDESACFGYSHSDQSFIPGYISPFTEHDELKYDVLNYSEIIGNIHQHPNLITDGSEK